MSTARQTFVVLSADALVSEDMAELSAMPNFRKYLEGGARVEKVVSIYPTITYPCHTTMATGCWPDRHGIPGNLKSPYLSVKSPVPWIWEHDAVKVPDLFDLAKKAGYTTAAVFWPCTGNHPSIDHLIDEYWTQRPGQTLVEAFREMGTGEDLVPIIERHAHLMRERKHPYCDDFMVACAADILCEFSPDLLMIHPANIDGARHGAGVFGPHITKTLEDTDRWIGELMEAAPENTNFILTSDHSQMDIKRVIHINVLLADAGLIRPSSAGGEPEWDAWCQSGGMSACVYLKDQDDRAVYDKTYALLRHLCEEGVYGISRVYTKEEAVREEHYGGDFSFVLETDNYTSFGDHYVRPLVTGADNGDYRKGRATHGYLPSKGPCPVFYAKGPAFRSGASIAEGRLVDEAPTIARAMGFEMPDADGVPMTQLLK